MKKNWKTISCCSNEQLRLNLIAAKGKIEEGLAIGFPQYFLATDAIVPQISKLEFLRAIESIDRRDDLLDAVKEAGLPHERFSFSGSCHGSTDGVSYTDGSYHTTANGDGEYFYRSTKKSGEEVEYQGTAWVVVWNRRTAGSPRNFATHSLVLVPVAAFAIPE